MGEIVHSAQHAASLSLSISLFARRTSSRAIRVDELRRRVCSTSRSPVSAEASGGGRVPRFGFAGGVVSMPYNSPVDLSPAANDAVRSSSASSSQNEGATL